MLLGKNQDSHLVTRERSILIFWTLNTAILFSGAWQMLTLRAYEPEGKPFQSCLCKE